MSKIPITKLNGKPSVKILINRIKNIDSSYNNPWDILAELTQNCVDAIKQREDIEFGNIEIEIDARNRAIKISDNGIGIGKDEIQELLSLDGTNKRDDDKTIGEKGVGLKFVIFQSNYFLLKSFSKNSTSVKASLENALKWKLGQINEEIEFDIDNADRDVVGTEVYIRDIENFDIFDLNIKQIEFVLRTKTAIGNTLKMLNKEDKDIKVKLKYRAKDADNFEEKDIPYKFLAIDEKLEKHESLDAGDALEMITSGKYTEGQIVDRFKNKIFLYTQIIQQRDRDIIIKYFYVSSNGYFEKITRIDPVILPDYLDLEKFDYIGFQKGITTSVKGMPTGIYLKEPQTGFAGYWPRFFIIIEDPNQKFDIGRKTIDESVHGKTKTMYLDKIREVFNTFFIKISRYISSENTKEMNEINATIDNTWEAINQKSNLNLAEIKFQKIPDDQEAGVFALFFECLGRDIIKEIKPFYCSYKNQYDLYVKIGDYKRIIEFKSKLSKVIKDFGDLTKMFRQINCLVCWDVDDKDIKEFKKHSISLTGILRSSFGDEDFPNATHKLVQFGNDPIYVIDLKIVLENYKKSII